MKTYNQTSWVDPRLYICNAKAGNQGVCTKESIKTGEIVIIFGGTVFSKSDVKKGKVKKNTLLRVDEDLYLGTKPEEESSIDDFLNHSCDPNLWMEDEVTLAARREIAAGEELTADYGMWIGDSEWKMQEECKCGSKLCRRIITGNDWELKILKERYSNHFSPYLNKRIK